MNRVGVTNATHWANCLQPHKEKPSGLGINLNSWDKVEHQTYQVDSQRLLAEAGLPTYVPFMSWIDRATGTLMYAADSNANAVAVTVWAPPKTWSPVIVAGALRKLVNELFDPYPPELHYMRGPGPRWREKHALDFVTVAGIERRKLASGDHLRCEIVRSPSSNARLRGC